MTNPTVTALRARMLDTIAALARVASGEAKLAEADRAPATDLLTALARIIEADDHVVYRLETAADALRREAV